MRFYLLTCVALALFMHTAQAEIVTREIDYNDGDVKLTGFAAYDDGANEFRPGILVVHEWWGHNDYARSRAKQLAEMGYVAFALDMYGAGVKAETPEEATKLSKPFYDDRQLMAERAEAGLNVLRSLPKIHMQNIAVIGYCFGGTVALEMARAGLPVEGAVSLHGGLSTPRAAQPGEISAEILALNGGDDPLVPATEKESFMKEMIDARVKFASIDYPGATHAFTNPAATDIGKKFSLPVAYNEKADKESWQEMTKFLARVLEKEGK